MKGNLKGMWVEERKDCFGDIFVEYCVKIFFSSCYFLKYYMMLEIMGFIYFKIRIFIVICY